MLEKDLEDNPITFFNRWFEEVEAAAGLKEANAMTVSTVGADGFPKGRVVLLKYFDTNGFTFFTNYNSDKGKSIQENDRVSLSFFWPNLERQVIIKGWGSKCSESISDSYFNSRPRMSRLGAIASEQSSSVKNREVLEKRIVELEKTYEGKDIPRPNHWGGFTVKPISIEFWQGRESRLHDRILYTLEDEIWKWIRLQP